MALLPLVAALGATAPAAGQALPDLFGAALGRDPAVTAAAAQARAAEERLVQARAAFGPTVALTGSYNDTRLHEAGAPEARHLWGRQAALRLDQPLLRPALLPARSRAQAQLEQAQAQLAQTRQESGQRLAEAVFELFKARDTLAYVQAQRAHAAEQLATAQRRYRLGSAPVTDLREAEARADVVMAQLAAAEHELQMRLQLLQELSGVAPQRLLTRGLESEQLPQLATADFDRWLQEALEASPQVAQARRAIEAEAAEVRRARMAHAPTLDLSASRIHNKDTGTLTTLVPRDYTATQLGVSLNVPLFASGATESRVREALAQQDRAQGELEAARRAVSVGVRQQFSAALSAIAQARGLVAAVRSGEVALQANRRGYEAGMRVMVELLNAQSRLFDTQRELTRSRYEAWLAWFRLQALAGHLGEEDFRHVEGLLVAVQEGLRLQAPQRGEAR